MANKNQTNQQAGESFREPATGQQNERLQSDFSVFEQARLVLPVTTRDQSFQNTVDSKKNETDAHYIGLYEHQNNKY